MGYFVAVRLISPKISIALNRYNTAINIFYKLGASYIYSFDEARYPV